MINDRNFLCFICGLAIGLASLVFGLALNFIMLEFLA